MPTKFLPALSNSFSFLLCHGFRVQQSESQLHPPLQPPNKAGEWAAYPSAATTYLVIGRDVRDRWALCSPVLLG